MCLKEEQSGSKPSIGLVLSGGGAKGAYHAGVIKALNALDIKIDMLAGASIGALNGALIAAADDQQQAADHIDTLWRELAQRSPVKIGSSKLAIPDYLSLLAAFGLQTSALTALAAELRQRLKMLPPALIHLIEQFLPWVDALGKAQGEEGGMLCDQRIKQLVDQYLGQDGLPARLPLYVSVYPTESVGQDLMRILAASFGIGDTANSTFIKAQSLPPSQQKKLLLASAALPILYAARDVNGTMYSDGGQGGWREVQGNTPIQPLLDAGCTHVIVTHLTDGSMWDRAQFPHANIIEIRPKTTPIKRKSALSDLLGFDNERIPSWIEQGYADTLACIAPIKQTLDAFHGLAQAERGMELALSQTGQLALRDAMRQLDER